MNDLLERARSSAWVLWHWAASTIDKNHSDVQFDAQAIIRELIAEIERLRDKKDGRR